MDAQAAEGIYTALFDAFPSLRKWMESNPRVEQTKRHWVNAMHSIDESDASAVVGMLVAGDIELPASYDRDRVPQLIQRHARNRANERWEREHAAKLSQQARATQQVKKVHHSPVGRTAVALGELVKYHAITAEENNAMLDEMLAWDRGNGERPAWLDGLDARVKQAHRQYFSSRIENA